MSFTWSGARYHQILSYHVPGTFGVAGLKCTVLYAQNAPPTKDCAYIAFNKDRTMLMILHVRADGRCAITKEYTHTPRRRFAVDTLLTSKSQTAPVRKAALEKLITVLEETRGAE